MAIYLIIDFLILISLFTFKDKKKICLLFLCVLFLLSAFRSLSVGSDYLVYYNQFNESTQGTFFECLTGDYFIFKIYCRFLKMLNFDYRGFTIVTSAIVALLFWLSAKKTENSLLTLFIYFSLGLYLQTFCIIRQSLAVLIIMYGFSFLKNFTRKNCLIYYFLNLIAIGFHIVSIVALVIPIVFIMFKKFNINRSKSVLFGFLGFIILFFTFKYLSPYISSFFSDKYSNLYGTDGSRAFGGNILGGLLYLLLYFAAYCIYCLKFNTLSDERKKYIGIYFIIAFSFTAFSFISDDLGRLNLFIESNLVLIISEMLFEDYNKKNSIFPWILLFFFMYLILYLIRDSIGVVPYVFGL